MGEKKKDGKDYSIKKVMALTFFGAIALDVEGCLGLCTTLWAVGWLYFGIKEAIKEHAIKAGWWKKKVPNSRGGTIKKRVSSKKTRKNKLSKRRKTKRRKNKLSKRQKIKKSTKYKRKYK